MPIGFLTAVLRRSPSQRGVRVIGLARLQRVLEEAARVQVRVPTGHTGRPWAVPDPETTDPEAVHDFRVALRRLRIWLRIFRRYLADTLGRRPGRRLRTLSRLAGRTRDLEVALRWLSEPRSGFPASARVAAEWLAGWTSRELARARRALVEGLQNDLPRAGAELTAALQRYHEDVVVEEPVSQPMAAAMGEALRHATETLAHGLGRVRSVEQVAEAHAARIAIKRLRYLLEAYGPAARSSSTILPRLTTLQHLFGELHDAQMLERRVRKMRAGRKGGRKRAGVGRPSPTAISALQVVLTSRIATAFGRVDRAIRSRATRSMLRRLARPRPGRCRTPIRSVSDERGRAPRSPCLSEAAAPGPAWSPPVRPCPRHFPAALDGAHRLRVSSMQSGRTRLPETRRAVLLRHCRQRQPVW
jgi:CHAD domain-containing protein